MTDNGQSGHRWLPADHPAPYGVRLDFHLARPLTLVAADARGAFAVADDPGLARKFSQAGDAASWIDGHDPGTLCRRLRVIDLRTGRDVDTSGTPKDAKGGQP